MKWLLPPLLLLSFISTTFGQNKSALLNQQLSIDFGSFRNRYAYPITDLKYSAPLLMHGKVRYSARLRSYGTLFFFSKSAYDVTPIVEYYFSKNRTPIYFSAGIGLDARIRLVHDERSDAKSSAEPLLTFTMHGNYKKLTFNAPFWSRFYSNGISFSLLPEASYKLHNTYSLFFRYEITYLTSYQQATHEWQRDCFIGAHLYF